MTTAHEWVEETREMLGGGGEQVNRLADDYTPGDTTVTLQYELRGVGQGIPIGVGLNALQVWSTNPQSKQVEVSPQWAGSPNVFAPAGTVVRVKPNFYTHRILKALNDVLSEICTPASGMYAVGIQDIVWEKHVSVFDLSSAEGITKVLRVQAGYLDDEMERWGDLSSTQYQDRKVEPTDDFPSGHQLRVFYDTPNNVLPDGDTLRVIYRRDYLPLDTLEDDVTNTLLQESAHDIPPIGAASRLSVPQEFRRNLLNAQPDTRRSEEVPAGASSSGTRILRGLFDSRVQQEATRLMSNYPPRYV
jgi:hypothetical protein